MFRKVLVTVFLPHVGMCLQVNAEQRTCQTQFCNLALYTVVPLSATYHSYYLICQRMAYEFHSHNQCCFLICWHYFSSYPMFDTEIQCILTWWWSEEI